MLAHKWTLGFCLSQPDNAEVAGSTAQHQLFACILKIQPQVLVLDTLPTEPTCWPCFILWSDKILCFQLLVLPGLFMDFLWWYSIKQTNSTYHLHLQVSMSNQTLSTSMIKSSSLPVTLPLFVPYTQHPYPCKRQVGHASIPLDSPLPSPTNLIIYSGDGLCDLRSLDPFSLLLLKLRTLSTVTCIRALC